MTVTAEIEAVGVVIPARNEQDRLPRCLAAVTAASTFLRSVDPVPPTVSVIVVVDRSTDATLKIARSWPGVEVIKSAAGRVGGARDRGVRHLLASRFRLGIPARSVWVSCTDADSAVPLDWLATHLHHARSGADLVLGAVRPDPDELATGLLAAWRLRHLIRDGHPHVHGANLGIRGDMYRAAGGFPDVAAHEDELLSHAVRVVGGQVRSIGASPVLTSARLTGRTPHGFAEYLRVLDGDEVPLEA